MVCIAAVFALLAVERRVPLTLPAPTGPFAVGRVIEDWIDPRTDDILAPIGGTKREVLAWIWYPAAADPTAVSDYLPLEMRAARGSATGLFSYLTRDLSKVYGHATPNAPVSPQARPYPVVLMRGGASAEVVNYSTLAEDLASHGYVVVGIDAPYRTGTVAFPDGRTVRRRPENNPELCEGRPDQDRCIDRILSAWTADMGFAVSRLAQLNVFDPSGRLTGALDLTRVGAFGHSLGGAEAAEFCHIDARCKAAVDIDGAPFGDVVHQGVDRPFMFLLSSQGDFSTDEQTRHILADVRSIYERLPPQTRHFDVIRGANHFTFSDDGALLKSRLVRGILRLFGALRMNGDRQLAVTAYALRSFFDVYLKGTPRVLQFDSQQYPEIVSGHGP